MAERAQQHRLRTAGHCLQVDGLRHQGVAADLYLIGAAVRCEQAAQVIFGQGRQADVQRLGGCFLGQQRDVQAGALLHGQGHGFVDTEPDQYRLCQGGAHFDQHKLVGGIADQRDLGVLLAVRQGRDDVGQYVDHVLGRGRAVAGDQLELGVEQGGDDGGADAFALGVQDIPDGFDQDVFVFCVGGAFLALFVHIHHGGIEPEVAGYQRGTLAEFGRVLFQQAEPDALAPLQFGRDQVAGIAFDAVAHHEVADGLHQQQQQQ